MKHSKLEAFDVKVQERINQIRNVSEALFVHLYEFIDKGMQFLSDHLRVYPRPWVGEKNYLFTFFKGVNASEIDRISCILPENYINLLLVMNGAHIYSMELFGVASRVVGHSNFIDYEKFQARDISHANSRLKRDYGLSDEYTYFAVRPYSFTENVGYFFDKHGRISARLKNGNIVGDWESLEGFFQEELEKSRNFEEKQNQLYLQ